MQQVFDELKLKDREQKVMSYLMKHGSGASADMQGECQLQQPEISMAMKALVKRGYIQSETIATTKKNGGRPNTIYSLIEDLYKRMIEELRKLVTESNDRAESLISLMAELREGENKKKTTKKTDTKSEEGIHLR